MVGPGITRILNFGFLINDLKTPDIQPSKRVVTNNNKLKKPELSLHHSIIESSICIV